MQLIAVAQIADALIVHGSSNHGAEVFNLR